MARKRKIKSYKKIYTENTGPFSSPLAVVGMVLGVALLAIIGWSAYGPVYNFVMQIGVERPVSEAPSSLQPEGDGPGGEGAESPGGTPGADAPEPEPVDTLDGLRAVFMPSQFASDLNRVDAFLGSLPAGAYDTVVVDLKDSVGAIYYRTAVEMATLSEAVAPGGLEAPALAARIRQAGYRPAARIHAFSDHIASGYNRDAAVKYMDTDWTWLDNSADLGGRPWLSPYSEVAQNYIIDIATELTEGGFALILVDSVHFPTGVGIERAGYAEEGATPRLRQLQNFASALSGAVEAAGGQCAVYIPISSVLAPSNLVYGGSPLDIHGGTVVVGMMPGSILAGTTVGETAIADPMGDPTGTVSALFGAIPPGDWGRTLAWLQGYGADGSAADTAFVAGQIRGVPAEAKGYIVYNPQGSYRP